MGGPDAQNFLGWLLDASHRAGPDSLSALASDGARLAGALDAEILLVDHEQTVLVPLRGDGDPTPIDHTRAGRSFSHIEVVTGEIEGSRFIWAPLLDGTDRMGVIAFEVREVDEEMQTRCRWLAGLLAELVATRSKFGDLIEMRRRSQPMSLSAELLKAVLPPLTHATQKVVISCILAPCYDVGGDAFDYSVDEDVARFAIFDAMGHGMDAAMLATVTLAAYRRARRRRLSLHDTYTEITRTLNEQFGFDRFVTGIICELDLATGVLRRINAGHPGALLIGADGRVEPVPIPDRSVPFGIGGPPVVIEITLHPGDRLIFYTDGVTEARDDGGRFFGLDELTELVLGESDLGHAAPELLRRLSLAIVAHQKGVFQDDATTMIVEWLGPDRDRTII